MEILMTQRDHVENQKCILSFSILCTTNVFTLYKAFIFNLDLLGRIFLDSATMTTSHGSFSHIATKITPLALLTKQSSGEVQRFCSLKNLTVATPSYWEKNTSITSSSTRQCVPFYSFFSFFPTNRITCYHQKFLLHFQGTHIQTINYTPDTTIVDIVLQSFRTYIISNTKIVPCNMKYQIVDHSFQWVLTTSTSMELVMDSLLAHSLAVPTFTTFSELRQHKSTDTNLNFLAIVVDISNSRSVNGIYGASIIQVLVLITEEKIPILLSCRNDFITSKATPIIEAAANLPIMAGLCLRAQEYRDLSLAVKGSVNLILNPSYPDAELLKTWRTANQEFLANLAHEKHYITHPPSHKFDHHTQATSIAEMINYPHVGHFTVRAHLSLPPEEQVYYYMSCPSCFHNTTTNPGMQFTCQNCDKQDLPKPRACYTMTISDDLTQIGIVTFGEVAAKIIGISAFDLLHMDTQINNTLANNTYEFHVRKKTSSSQHATPFYYNFIDNKLITNKGVSSNAPLQRATTTTANQGAATEIPGTTKKYDA